MEWLKLRESSAEVANGRIIQSVQLRLRLWVGIGFALSMDGNGMDLMEQVGRFQHLGLMFIQYLFRKQNATNNRAAK